jgi:hypothetical protein
MFDSLTLRGDKAASIAWGYHVAAVLRAWRVSKQHGKWSLSAGIDRADRFQLQQRPLYFTAALYGRQVTFPVQTVTVGSDKLTASLGPPEG